MKLRIRNDWLAALGQKWKDTCRYSTPDKWQEVNLEDFTPAELDALLAQVEKFKDVKGVLAIKQKIKLYRGLAADTSTKITKLEAVPLAVRKLLENLPHHWLFADGDGDGHLVPWFVYKAEYTPPDARNACPARVTIDLAATRHNATVSTWLSIVQFHLL